MQLKLTPEQAAGELRQMLQARGWAIVEHTLNQAVENVFAEMMNAKRDPAITDERLKGRIEGLQFAKNHFKSVVTEYDVNKARDAVRQTGDQPIGSPYSAGADDPPPLREGAAPSV